MARGEILSINRKRTRKAPREEAKRYREYNGHYYYRCDNGHEVQVTDIEYFNAIGRLAHAEARDRGPRIILRKNNTNSNS
tara:strand:+ start:307 stop:546 length:240 start_codon:yes stop_codon:yes gene_type:complete